MPVCKVLRKAKGRYKTANDGRKKRANVKSLEVYRTSHSVTSWICSITAP